MAIYHHKESDLQIRLVRYLRTNYPALARLLEHPKNEGCGGSTQDKKRQAIAKAEGVQAGVADLIWHIPSTYYVIDGVPQEEPYTYFSLAMELKTKVGRQSAEQKLFQRYFEAAGGLYIIVRSFEDGQKVIDEYAANIPSSVYSRITQVYEDIEREQVQAARAELNRIINK